MSSDVELKHVNSVYLDPSSYVYPGFEVFVPVYVVGCFWEDKSVGG